MNSRNESSPGRYWVGSPLRAAMRRPEMKEMFLDDMLRAGRQPLHTPIYDIVLFARPWGFSLRDIRVPIRFWHGDADRIVPLAHGEHQAKLVPDSDLKIRPREGHMGSLDAAEEILGTILSLWPGETARSAGGLIAYPRKTAKASIG